jgi:hypothetical protein
MTLKLGHFLNKTILVSIPALFEDGACRSYTLRGVDLPGGLWLQSDDLSRRLLADDKQVLVSASPVVFVPFAQIAGVLIPTTLPADFVSGSAQRPRVAAGTHAKDKACSVSRTPAGGSTKTKKSR